MRRKSAQTERERGQIKREGNSQCRTGGYCFKFVWCVHTHGQQPTAERGNGGYLFKVGDNRGTMASEGSKELMRGAVVAAVGGAVGQNTS